MHTNNNNNNKRRSNNMGGGNGGNGQPHRHNNNNRPRRFGTNNNNNRSEGGDSANVARARRNAMQSREKYQAMARDAMSMGDRVLAENYLQHADHYFRVLLALPPEEVRQPYPRPDHNAQNGDAENGAENHADQQGQSDNGESANFDNHADGHHASDENLGGHISASHMPPATMLPTFLTQPAQPIVQENIEE
jgi:hypothetical protein